MGSTSISLPGTYELSQIRVQVYKEVEETGPGLDWWYTNETSRYVDVTSDVRIQTNVRPTEIFAEMLRTMDMERTVQAKHREDLMARMSVLEEQNRKYFTQLKEQEAENVKQCDLKALSEDLKGFMCEQLTRTAINFGNNAEKLCSVEKHLKEILGTVKTLLEEVRDIRNSSKQGGKWPHPLTNPQIDGVPLMSAQAQFISPVVSVIDRAAKEKPALLPKRSRGDFLPFQNPTLETIQEGGNELNISEMPTFTNEGVLDATSRASECLSALSECPRQTESEDSDNLSRKKPTKKRGKNGTCSGHEISETESPKRFDTSQTVTVLSKSSSSEMCHSGQSAETDGDDVCHVDEMPSTSDESASAPAPTKSSGKSRKKPKLKPAEDTWWRDSDTSSSNEELSDSDYHSSSSEKCHSDSESGAVAERFNDMSERRQEEPSIFDELIALLEKLDCRTGDGLTTESPERFYTFQIVTVTSKSSREMCHSDECTETDGDDERVATLQTCGGSRTTADCLGLEQRTDACHVDDEMPSTSQACQLALSEHLKQTQSSSEERDYSISKKCTRKHSKKQTYRQEGAGSLDKSASAPAPAKSSSKSRKKPKLKPAEDTWWRDSDTSSSNEELSDSDYH